MYKNNQVIQKLVNLIGACQEFKVKSNRSDESSEERVRSSGQCMDEQVKLNQFMKLYAKAIPKRSSLAQLAANGDYQGMLNVLRNACGDKECSLCKESTDVIKRHPYATMASIFGLVAVSAEIIFCHSRK